MRFHCNAQGVGTALSILGGLLVLTGSSAYGESGWGVSPPFHLDTTDWGIVTSPNGGENWVVGSLHDITWTTTSGINSIKIEYTTNNGSTWTIIVPSTPASTSSYPWSIPGTPSAQCKVRLSDADNALILDTSDFRFSIALCARPFGSTPAYDHGFALTSPAVIAQASSEYLDWKANFVTDVNAGGYRRVKYDQSTSDPFTTKSEGIGYGMLLSAYYGDRSLFDDLFEFSRNHRNDRGLMCWSIPYSGEIPPPGSSEYNAATDGDEDIAMALVVADYQWGSDGAISYASEAAAIVEALYDYTVIQQPDPHSYLIMPGDSYGAATCLNPSYFAPAYYPYFQHLTGNDSWSSVLSSCCAVLTALSAVHSSHLIGDWTSFDGGSPYGSGCDDVCREENYGYDASRIPWRIGVHYLWTGVPASGMLCDAIVNTIRSTAPPIIDGYYVDSGQPIPSWDVICDRIYGNTNNPIIAGLQTGSMVMADPELLADLYNCNLARSDNWFYNRTLKVLSLFVVSGNFWSPPINAGTPPAARVTRGVTEPGLVLFDSPGNITATSIDFRSLPALRDDPDTSIVTVRRFDDAALDPAFVGGPPSFVSDVRWAITLTDTLPLDAEVRFDLSALPPGMPDPNDLRICLRGTEGVGLFEQLATSYDSSAAELRAGVSSFGEFILATEGGSAQVEDRGGEGTRRLDLVIKSSPNPTRRATTIQYRLPMNAFVSLAVYDVAGHEVARLVNEEQPAGFHEVEFLTERLGSGVYLCSLRAGGLKSGGKLLVVR